MPSMHIFILALKIGVSYCRLKNMGEVTNFSLFVDLELPRLGERTKLTIGQSKLLSGGTPAHPRDLPHNVVFLNYEGVCEGVIISDNIVLVAAHCLDANENLLEMRVFAGSRYLFDPTADAHKVWDFAIHDGYNKPIRFANDAALLIIKDKFRFKSTVNKALLINHKSWMKKGNVIKVSGWGGSIFDRNTTYTTQALQTVDLHFLPLSICRNELGAPLSPDMFCLSSDKNHGTCRGDSGSGALWNNIIVGLASYGGTCGENPEVYTNVYYLRPWIDLASKKLYYKYCHFHEDYAGESAGDY